MYSSLCMALSLRHMNRAARVRRGVRCLRQPQRLPAVPAVGQWRAVFPDGSGEFLPLGNPGGVSAVEFETLLPGSAERSRPLASHESLRTVAAAEALDNQVSV